MKFNYRIDDLELRSCDKHLLTKDIHDRAEIIMWYNNTDEKKYCFTVAYWTTGKKGYNLQFVGDRPFDVDSKVFMKLAKQGQQILDDAFSHDYTLCPNE